MTTAPASNKFPLGCFAPPLTDELIAEYGKAIRDLGDETPVFLAEKTPGELAELQDKLGELLTCVKVWWELPESEREGTVWQVKDLKTKKLRTLTIRPLEEDHVDKLYDVTPWPRDVEALKALFVALPSGREERIVVVPYKSKSKDGTITKTENVVVDPAAAAFYDMAHHLLWHVLEISNDREPFTQDKYK